MSDAARALLTLFDRLTLDERAEVLEGFERREDEHWNARADEAAADGGEPVPALDVRRQLECDGVL